MVEWSRDVEYADNKGSSHSLNVHVPGGGMVEIAVRLGPLDTIQTAPTLSRQSLVPCCFSVVGFGPAYLDFAPECCHWYSCFPVQDSLGYASHPFRENGGSVIVEPVSLLV